MRRPAWIIDVIESLRSRPGWVGLACFSITVGMAALCLLIAVLGGVQMKTRQMVAELGVNVWGILQPAVVPEPARIVLPLTRRHVQCLQAALPGADVTGVQRYESRETGLPDGTLLLAADYVLDARLVLQIQQFARRDAALLQLHIRADKRG